MKTANQWSHLNNIQLGRYAEYLAKMEFVLLGCDVFSSEVDDHGIDFVVRTTKGVHYDVQVKSYRPKVGKNPYIFMRKTKFDPSPTLLLLLIQFVDGNPPTLFLVQSSVESKHHPLFENREYGEGKKSKPEWGITINKSKLATLSADCGFHATVKRLIQAQEEVHA